MSMSCADYTDLILRLPDAELEAEEAEMLRSHLASCPDCRRVFRAVKNVAEDLDELEDAPSYLAENVMSRIRIQGMKEEAVNVRSNAGTARNVRKKHARRRVGKVLAIAASFAIILGGGGYLASLFLDSIDAANSAATQSVVLEEPHMVANAAAGAAPVPAPEAAEFESEAALDAGNAQFAAAEEDAAPAETRMQYTWENPAQVPEGREEDFEALIQDAGWPDGVPQTPWEVFIAVEYQGIIYEFLTDPDGEFLLWRDAAESVVAIHSPGTVEDLWAIIG